MNNFGARLKEERERLNLSQTSLAEAGGVGRKSQFNYESGDRLPDAKYLSAIASLGIDINYLFTGERLENIASTPMELAFLRNCRAFKDNSSRQMALNALVAMSGYKPLVNDEQNEPPQDQLQGRPANWCDENN